MWQGTFTLSHSEVNALPHYFPIIYVIYMQRNELDGANEAGRVRFGDFELDVRTGELFAPGRDPVLLREQPFRILRLLLERRGDIVSRQEIQQILWPNDTVVEFDRSINVAMAILRKALADDADHPKYIETLARRGYRLISPVEWQQRPTAAVAEQKLGAPGNRRKAALLAVGAVLVVATGYLSWRRFVEVTPPESKKIMLAVLPFENLTGDPTKEYLADGLTEATISRLGRLDPSQLGVIARTSVMRYKHQDDGLDQIGRDLSVQYVLESSLRESGGVLRITSQLIQVKDQSHLWAQDYDYRAQDILAVQDDVARAVVREVQLRLTAQQQAQLARSQSVHPAAFDAYLQGYYFFERNTDKDTDMAAKYYERATQLDSSYALAWVGLSRVRNWQVNQGLIPMAEGRRLAREAIERALALDPNLAAAHSQQGRLRKFVDFDWIGADSSIQRAIALEPGNPEYLLQSSTSAAVFGRSEEALAIARRSVDLDPLNPGSWSQLGELEYYEGQWVQAEADVKKSLELSPDVWPGSILLTKIYLMQGRLQDAEREIERVRYDWARTWLSSLRFAAMGREQESDAALKELIATNGSRGAFLIAGVHAFRNQRDQAFEWLDRAYAQHNGDVFGTTLEPLLENLRSDPRYAAFLKKVNLPQ